MTLPRIGLDLPDKSTGHGALAAIERAEARGVPMVWSTVGGVRPDAMSFFAAGAARTTKIGMGTAIVPTYSRHPAVLASQALVLSQLAPMRFRLGIGPSHKPNIVDAFGLPFGKPLDHLREYLTVLRQLVDTGDADFTGDYFDVHISGGTPSNVPIYISALRQNAFRLAGEIADGALSWLCPIHYLRTTAIPAMTESARNAGRAVPRMVAHVPVVMSPEFGDVQTAARPVVSRYARLPFYANMFADAGYPVPDDGAVTDDLLDHLIVNGDDATVASRLRAILGEGIDELLVMLIPATDPDGEEERLSRIVAEIGNDSQSG